MPECPHDHPLCLELSTVMGYFTDSDQKCCKLEFIFAKDSFPSSPCLYIYLSV